MSTKSSKKSSATRKEVEVKKEVEKVEKTSPTALADVKADEQIKNARAEALKEANAKKDSKEEESVATIPVGSYPENRIR